MPSEPSHAVEVTTTTLRMDVPPAPREVAPPTGVRIDRVGHPTPEFVRWLYGSVGGPWRWVDRLGWGRAAWDAELAAPGSEVWVAYLDGTPAGYVQLGAEAADGGTAVEIRYFGLHDWAHGRGLGRDLLGHAVARAWDLPARHDLPATTYVWVHTCSLDGPAALPNYRARGFVVVGEVVTREVVPVAPLGAWASTGGPA